MFTIEHKKGEAVSFITLPAKEAVAQIVEEYRIMTGDSNKPATLREFAAALSEATQPGGRGVSYQSIKNWSDRTYLPDSYFMVRLEKLARRDWRGQFAGDILAALHPETYQPVSEIGRRALQAGRELAKHLNRRIHKGGNGNGTH